MIRGICVLVSLAACNAQENSIAAPLMHRPPANSSRAPEVMKQPCCVLRADESQMLAVLLLRCRICCGRWWRRCAGGLREQAPQPSYWHRALRCPVLALGNQHRACSSVSMCRAISAKLNMCCVAFTGRINPVRAYTGSISFVLGLQESGGTVRLHRLLTLTGLASRRK